MEYILITGGGGFIGINLVLFLLKNTNHGIIVLDNFITSNKENIRTIQSKNQSRIIIYEQDLCDLNIVNTFINVDFQKNKNIKQIYHLASLASPKFYKKYTLQTLDVGYIGTRNILEIAKHYRCKILYTSTSEVYGDPLVHPQKEEYYGNVNTIGERSNYDESKRIAETLMITYKNLYNLNIRIARVFNTYGPFMNLDDGRIVTEIIKSIIKRTELNIYGSGKQTRSLCYVDDTVEQLYRLMNSEYELPVNIGNDNEISINKLVDEFEILTGILINKKYINIDKDDPKCRKPDLQLNKQLLRYNNKYDLITGIFLTYNYFRSQL